MAPLTALFDACVLYPAPLRDMLMWLAMTDLFRARWTDRIHQEWIRNVLADRPDLTPAMLERTRNRMNDSVMDCLVTGYEPLIEGITLPDPDDRHILAAAIHGRADVIVTFNLGDFPSSDLERFGIEAQHPDEFVSYLMDQEPESVYAAVKEWRANLRNPPKSVEELLETLQRQRLPQTVSRLQRAAHLL